MNKKITIPALLTALLLLLPSALVSCRGNVPSETTTASTTSSTTTAATTTEHVHSYTELTFPASCTADGYTLHICGLCGDSYTDNTIARFPHTYTEYVTPPTCTADGFTQYVCAGCGDSYTAAPVPRLAHQYISQVIPPTGAEQGYTEHICSVCGDSFRDSYTETDHTSIIVMFAPNGGTLEGHVTRTYQNGTHVDLPTPTREGYTFEGWFFEKGEELIRVESGIWRITENCILQAEWTLIRVNVRFDAASGTMSNPFRSFVWGEPLGELPTPTVPFGHLFDGWYDGETPVTAETVSRYTDTPTLTARYIAPKATGEAGEDLRYALRADGTLCFEGTGTRIAAGAFEGMTEICAVELPQTLKDLGGGAFRGCTGLRSIRVPGSVGVIRSSVFADCSALTEVIVESGISVINEEAFAGCSALTTLTLPQSLFQIYSPFEGCTALREIRYEGNVFHWSVIVKDAAALATLSDPALHYVYDFAPTGE